MTICRAVVESRRPMATDHEIVFESELDSMPAELDGDRILQVIDNLVSNALKYTNQGRITVQVSADNNRAARIEITDEGSGIRAVDRDHLFTPFYRARSATESAVPGLGLGLYICRELIDAHEGTIEVDDAPGGGARFTIMLPWYRPADALATA